MIGRRIDKVKEWLVYSDQTLTDIAHRTGYSSVQHLSNQFRQQTGLTPSYFRQVRQQKQAVQQGRKLSPGIIKAQQTEIAQMKAKLDELDK